MAVSYAQAAKGANNAAASRSSSSKVTSGAVTPAKDAPAEVISSGNWADDVEASVGEKASSSQKNESEEVQAQQPKDSLVERAKVADKAEDTPSGISSPDLAASASSTTKEDDSTSAQNGASSESTWDTKSQGSEPSWIVERKLRQDGLQSSETAEKNDKKSKEAALPSPPKPPALHEAAPPSVNVWAQRLANMKAAAPKPAPAPTVESAPLKENQKPAAPRRKASSVSGIARDAFTPKDGETKKSNPLTSNVNGSNTDSQTTEASKASSTERASEQSHAATFSSVKDDVSWPTPENVADKERKSSAEKEPDAQRAEDATPAGKKGKQQWQHLPVTPQYVPVELGSGRPRGAPGGDRSNPRTSTKPRGPPRGSSNPTGSNDRERDTSRSTSTPMNGDTTPSSQKQGSLSEDTNTTPVPSKPTRSSSTGPRGPGKKDMLPGRKFGRQPTGDSLQMDTASHEGAKQTTSKDNSFDKSFSEPRRTKSPKKTSPAGERTEADHVPKPIPRRNSAGTQTDDANAPAEGVNRDVQAPRPNGLEPRKESRTSEAGRDSNHQSRGAKRNGRGRGGARDFTNGHAYMGSPNGFGTDFSSSSPYGGAPSPGFQTPRGNHQFSYPPPRGGASFRGNPRSQSIPVDNFYNQNGRAGYPPYPMPGIQTFMPGMYDVNSYTMSAYPYTPQMETDQLMQTVTLQVEYYFSVNNLIKDMFLRKHMDSQGFVFLDIIANFNRIKQLTQDREILKAVCHNSQVIEIVIGDDQKERVRKREGWEPFCLPMEQREPSAQTTGAERLQPLERPQLSQLFVNQIPPQYHGPASAGLPNMHQRNDRRSYDSARGMANGYPPQFAMFPGYADHMYHEPMNGDEPRGRAAKSPIHENVTLPTEQLLPNAMSNVDFEPDAFPDEEINNLTVLVKNLREGESNEQPHWHSASSRTFSNGSIDSRSIMEMSKPSEAKNSSTTANGESLVNGSDTKLSLTRTLSPSKPQANSSTASSVPSPSDVNVFWVKEPESLANLPPGLAQESYLALRHRALEDRNRAVTGNCPYDLDVLYHFWSHFLLRNFNNAMYTEFKHYANQDAQHRYCFKGLKHLIQFFSQSLSSTNPIRDRVVKDYVALVENEPTKMEGAAFKSLRSAWRNGALNLKNRKKLTNVLSEHLKNQLDRVDA